MDLFRVFQTLCKQGDWFSFVKRRAHSPVCIDDNRSCMKHWKSVFFFIDRRAISDSMIWRHPSAAIDDPRENNRIFEELLRTLKTKSPVGEPKGSNDFMEGDEVISTIFERENDEFIKSSVDHFVPISKESELTLYSTDLECSMPTDSPLPCTDVLGDTIVYIDLLLGEHLDTLSTGNREIDFNPIRDIEELERLLADDPVSVPKVFDEALGHSDLISRLFDPGPPESTPIIDESSFLVTPLLDPKKICLREVERFDPFFSLTRSRGTRVMETPSFSSHHMPSPRPVAYSPTEVMYCYYHPHLTSGDGFDHVPKMK
nr:hypothetical protein [Tanacetum cinerariifolium]